MATRDAACRSRPYTVHHPLKLKLNARSRRVVSSSSSSPSSYIVARPSPPQPAAPRLAIHSLWPPDHLAVPIRLHTNPLFHSFSRGPAQSMPAQTVGAPRSFISAQKAAGRTDSARRVESSLEAGFPRSRLSALRRRDGARHSSHHVCCHGPMTRPSPNVEPLPFHDSGPLSRPRSCMLGGC